MTTQKNTIGKKASETKSSSFTKGKLVERIVADLHDSPNIKVEKNVHLPAFGNTTRKREIDVLVTYCIEGEPIQKVAIECKNYKKTIDVQLIDAFFGKLYDVGIPTQCGIFISVKGFTAGAIERAFKAGIKTHVLTGLDEERLSVKVDEAFQSIIFLLPTVTQVTIEYVHQIPNNNSIVPFLYDSRGKIKCSVFDLFWKYWQEGFPPSSIGEHAITLNISGEYFISANGKLEKIKALHGKVQVTGLLLSVKGHAQRHLLVNQANKEIDRFLTNPSFEKPTGLKPIISFQTEDKLQKFINEQESPVKLTLGRIRLPRIVAYSVYWPLSKRAFNAMMALEKNSQFNISELERIEGTDLKTVWEPVWDNNPILKGLT